jgi:hypothetical protein
MTHLQGQAVTSLTPWPNKDPMLLHIIRDYLPAYVALTSHKTGPLWEPQISCNTYSGQPILTSVSISWFWHFQEIIHTKYSIMDDLFSQQQTLQTPCHHRNAAGSLCQYATRYVAAYTKTVLTLATCNVLVSQRPNTVSLQLPGQLVLLWEAYSSQEQSKRQWYGEKCNM